MTGSKSQEKIVHIVDNLKKFWGFVLKYKSYFLFMLFFIFLIEATWVFEKYLFKVLIDNGTVFVEGGVTKEALAASMLLVAAVFIGNFLFRSVFNWIVLFYLNKTETYMIADLKRKFFNHLIHLDHEFHSSHKPGLLISRLSKGSKGIEMMMDSVAFNFAPLIFQLLVSFVSLLYLGWKPATIMFVTMSAFIAYSVWSYRKPVRSWFHANETEDWEKADVSDMFTNIDSVKYFGKENIVKRKYRMLSGRTRDAFMHAWGFFRTIVAVQHFILGIGTLFMIGLPFSWLLNGQISIGDVAFIYTVYLGLFGSVFGFVAGLRMFYTSMADFESLFQYNKFQNRIQDVKDAKELMVHTGAVEFNNISFQYHSQKLFDGFSLRIAPHQKVALVGHSGAGKSTLVKLLYRLYDLNAGQILIDGQDTKKFKQESLRSALSIVPQECVLFDDTIYNNIAFSNPEANANDVWNAMKFAQLDRFVAQLPEREKTVVGERGVKLSGGEKQRVSIARAILADKKILVLDEATSSLDSYTENEIQKDLEALMHGRTSIIIAHRLSTIMKADKIIVLDGGNIIQTGTHSELVEQKGQYKHLWELQKGGYIG